MLILSASLCIVQSVFSFHQGRGRSIWMSNAMHSTSPSCFLLSLFLKNYSLLDVPNCEEEGWYALNLSPPSCLSCVVPGRWESWRLSNIIVMCCGLQHTSLVPYSGQDGGLSWPGEANWLVCLTMSQVATTMSGGGCVYYAATPGAVGLIGPTTALPLWGSVVCGEAKV